MILSNTQRNTTLTFIFLLGCLSAGATSGLFAQCPPSTIEGVHVFQPEDNMDSLALQYGISQENIHKWNGLEMGQDIEECMKLIVDAMWVANTGDDVEEEKEISTSSLKPKPIIGVKQPGNWHKVMPGETVESIARLYGVNLDVLRNWNGIKAGWIIQEGSKLSTGMGASSVNARPKRVVVTDTPKAPPVAAADEPAKEPVMHKEEAPERMTDDVQSRGGSPITTPGKTYRTEMTRPENELLREVNFMRSNPKKYAALVKDYVKSRRKDKVNKYRVNPGDVKSVVERLKATAPLPRLRSNPCLYESAQKHGEYLAANNTFSHQGRNGEQPHERTLADCPEMELSLEKDKRGFMVGNENLGVGGDAREAVIRLLIDEGSDTAGHRNTLLAADWRFMVVHYFGTVRGVDDCFVQVFGK